MIQAPGRRGNRNWKREAEGDDISGRHDWTERDQEQACGNVPDSRAGAEVAMSIIVHRPASTATHMACAMCMQASGFLSWAIAVAILGTVKIARKLNTQLNDPAEMAPSPTPASTCGPRWPTMAASTYVSLVKRGGDKCGEWNDHCAGVPTTWNGNAIYCG